MDPLFVGATRPPMRWGVTYSALLFNMVFTLEAFLLTKNLLTLLLGAPIHGICVLLCARDARFFDLVCAVGAHAIAGAVREICAFGRRAVTRRLRPTCRIDADAAEAVPTGLRVAHARRGEP